MAKDIGRVVLTLRGRWSDIEIADWLVRQNPDLKEITPLAWIQHGLGLHPALRAAEVAASVR
jgi:hypothetical protein